MINNYQLTKSIVDNYLDNNAHFTWDNTQLSVNDRLAIYKLLEIKGIQLRHCDSINFPNSIQKLKQQINDPYMIHRGLAWINNSGAIEVTFLLAVILGIAYYGTAMLVWSLLVAWLTSNMAIIVSHEGWAHRYITPKNKLVELVLDMFAYVYLMLYSAKTSMFLQKKLWNEGHVLHHIEYATADDVVAKSVYHNWFLHTFITPYGKSNSFTAEHQLLQYQAQTELTTLPRLQQCIELHSELIRVLIHLAVVLVAGLELYFWFLVLPIYWNKVYNTFFTEVLPHRILKDKYDSWYLFPLMFHTAYHNSHHRKNFVVGSKISKWFNLQYYFIKIFYRINKQPTILDSFRLRSFLGVQERH